MNATPPASIRDTLDLLVVRELHLERGLSAGDLASQLDSMQRLSLVVAIEDHYKICFEPEDDEQVETVADVIALIETKLSEQEKSGEPPA